jgi:hypothetical protein
LALGLTAANVVATNDARIRVNFIFKLKSVEKNVKMSVCMVIIGDTASTHVEETHNLISCTVNPIYSYKISTSKYTHVPHLYTLNKKDIRFLFPNNDLRICDSHCYAVPYNSSTST